MAGKPDEKRMPFLEHLRELRSRIIVCFVAVIVGFAFAWIIHEDLFDWLMEPYEAAVLSLPDPFHQTVLSAHPGTGASVEARTVPLLRYKSLLEPFLVYLKTALLGGLFLALPVVFWQLWKFIAPGLYPSERKLAIPFIVGTTVFFLLGAAFCRYIVMEPACAMLLSVGAQNTEPLIMMQDYFGLMARFLIVFGAVFELPILIMFLALLGLVTHKTLLKGWRYAVVGAFVLGGVVTPTMDPFSQTALALPLLVLYFGSTGVAYIFEKRAQQRRQSGQPAATGS